MYLITGYLNSILFLLVLFMNLNLTDSLQTSGDLRNEIIGSPEVKCEREYIKFSVPTRQPFHGRVYVKGEYGNEECIRHYQNSNSYGIYQSGKYGGSQRKFEENEKELHTHRGTYIDEHHEHIYGEKERNEGRFENRHGYEAERERNGESFGFNNKENFYEKGSYGFEDRFGSTHSRGGNFDRPHPNRAGIRPNGFERSGLPFENFWRSGDRSKFGSGSGVHGQECPLVCPPCEKCEDSIRHRRQSQPYAELEVRLGTCNTRRDRSLSPPGIHVTFTIVVSFHDSFITRLDRAYRIYCSYAETDTIVTTQIDVDMPLTTELTGFIEPPRCAYSIYDLQSGQPVTNVMVGDQVKHEWRCDSLYGNPNIHTTYGMLVHNCFIEDGKGQKHLVIDERGYSAYSLTATIESAVVKFPDRTYLDFQCSIQVCIKSEGQCDGITPPNCGIIRSRRELADRLNNSQHDWKIYAKRLTVFDIDEKVENPYVDSKDSSALPFRLINNSLISDKFCVSVAGFGFLVSATTFLLTIISTALIGFIIIDRKHNSGLES